MSENQNAIWPRAVLFDLDGTLIDSVADLASSVNEVLAGCGLETLSLAEVRSMIGNGIPKLVERAFAHRGAPLSGDALGKAAGEMLAVYSRRLTARTTLMPGAAPALAAMARRGASLGLVTNKPQAATEAILAHFGLTDFFAVVLGGDAGFAKKPAPDMLLAALERMGAAVADAALVGDSGADVEAARAAGIQVIVVRGGYSRVPPEMLDADLVIDGLADLDAALWRMEADAALA